MALTLVELSSDAYLVCITHALTTEKEEVMGLLLGDIERNKSTGQNIAKITSVSILTRSDRRKDRVEISPEQLTAAAAEAEKITHQLKKTTRVIVWYHSHPHITVHPSHVDVNTQANYQMLDDGFVGLIFSVFNDDTTKKRGKIQVVAFQSLDLSKIAEQEKRDLKSPRNNNDDKTMTEEDRTKFKATIPIAPGVEMNILTSVVAEKVKSISSSPLSLLSTIEDPIRRSGYQEIEIPILIVSSVAKGPRALEKLVKLQEIMVGEEKTSYIKSLSELGKSHPLVQIHSAAVYQKSLCRLLEIGAAPLLQTLQDRKKYNIEKLASLEQEKRKLLEEFKEKPDLKKSRNV